MKERQFVRTAFATRRAWLQGCGAAASWLGLETFLQGGVLMNSNKPKPALAAADHLLWGVADLERGIAQLEKMTGVRAVIGGSHPGRGTRNALLSLGNKQYLEIIAPDPAQTNFAFQFDLRKFAGPKLVTWAAASTDISGLVQQAKTSGLLVSGPMDGSRARPDGKLLKWKTLAVSHQLAAPEVELVPFFIEWAAGSVHPSQDSPAGCRLTALTMEHPEPDKVRDLFLTLGIAVNVKRATRARLRAELQTPKGKVELS